MSTSHLVNARPLTPGRVDPRRALGAARVLAGLTGLALLTAGCSGNNDDTAGAAATAASKSAANAASKAAAAAGSTAASAGQAVGSAAQAAGSAVASVAQAAGSAAASAAAGAGADPHAGHDHAAHAAGGDGGTAASKGAPAGARVFFVWPQDNAKVFSTFPVVFGVEGMTVVPAGQDFFDNTKGHHHIVVDGDPPPQGQAVPADETHIHYGKGQTETELTLSPGKHTVTMQFADGAHLSYGPTLASKIRLEVVPLPEPPPKVFFKAPADGAKVKSPVKVVFGLEGMTVQPAGTVVGDKTTGHHHVIIDGAPVPAGKMVPTDSRHIHFGGGQTEAELTLAPGKHTLTLQFADGAHQSYGPTLASTVTIEVE